MIVTASSFLGLVSRSGCLKGCAGPVQVQIRWIRFSSTWTAMTETITWRWRWLHPKGIRPTRITADPMFRSF